MPRNASSLRSKLEDEAKAQGMDLMGVADITPLHDALCARGGEFLRQFPMAIAMGIRLLDDVVDNIGSHDSLFAQWVYRRCVVDFSTPQLDRASVFLAKFLNKAGYRGYPVGPAPIEGNGIYWAFPYKLTGYLAGLGWIGKNSLLVNPKFGPRFRLVVVLTDAPLAADSPMPVRCGTCRDCLDICPPKALATGAVLDPSRPREDWRHGEACDKYVNQRARELDFPNRKATCGLCLYVCPFGKKKRRAASSAEAVLQHA